MQMWEVALMRRPYLSFEARVRLAKTNGGKWELETRSGSRVKKTKAAHDTQLVAVVVEWGNGE